MKTKVVITVDVEPSIAGAFADAGRYEPLIHEPVWGEVAGKSEALGFLIETLTGYELRATFFVETAHVSYFPEHLMGGYVRRLVDAGQEIGLHLHPCWLNFPTGHRGKGPWVSDQCSDLADDRLTELIAEGCQRIGGWSGKSPECFRTGNFSVSRGIYRAMCAIGIRFSSNLCVAVNPPLDETLRLPGGVHRIEGVTELPVTCFTDNGPLRRRRLRPMQITACSFEEQRAMLMALHAARGSIAVIVTHPFEFLKWSGPAYSRMRPNRLVQRRFDRLCAFLTGNRDQFDVVPIDEIASAGIEPEEAIALNGGVISSTRRAVENFVNDHLPL